jgi:hypothetical protein
MPVRSYGHIILSYDMQYLSSPYLSTLINQCDASCHHNLCLILVFLTKSFIYQSTFLLIAMFNHSPRQIIMWSILLTLLLGNTLTDFCWSVNLDLFLCINKKMFQAIISIQMKSYKQSTSVCLGFLQSLVYAYKLWLLLSLRPFVHGMSSSWYCLSSIAKIVENY